MLGLVWNAIVYFVTFDFRFYCCFLCCLLLLLVFSFSFEQLDFNYLVYFSFPYGINCFLFSWCSCNLQHNVVGNSKKKKKKKIIHFHFLVLFGYFDCLVFSLKIKWKNNIFLQLKISYLKCRRKEICASNWILNCVNSWCFCFVFCLWFFIESHSFWFSNCSEQNFSFLLILLFFFVSKEGEIKWKTEVLKRNKRIKIETAFETA